MAINQTKKTSDLEKRFLKLNQQLTGKNIASVAPESKTTVGSTGPRGGFTFSASSYTPQQTTTASDIFYLKKSLIKILALSSLAIGAEILLYVLTKKHYLNLNF